MSQSTVKLLRKDEKEKYKSYLPQYLKLKGFDYPIGKLSTFPFIRDETTPSMQCNNDCIYDYGSDKNFDIFDCIEKIEGITDFKNQLEYAKNIFGFTEHKPVIQDIKPKKEFTPDPKAISKVIDFILTQNETPEAKQYKKFFSEKRGYNEDFSNYFGYYPGFDIASKSIGKETLINAGLEKWLYPGLVLRFYNNSGLKYIAYRDGKTFKYNSEGSKHNVYCLNGKLPDNEIIIITESEIDAICLLMNGLNNVISFSGINGACTENNLFIYNKYKEIIILFDNDIAGKNGSQKTAEKLKNKYPDKIIKIASLPDNQEGLKDTDDFNKAGKFDIVKNCIDNAVIYESIPEVKELNEDEKNQLYYNTIFTHTQNDIARILLIELKKQGITVIAKAIDKTGKRLLIEIKEKDKPYFQNTLSYQNLFRDLLLNAFDNFLSVGRKIAGNKEPDFIINYGKLIKKIGSFDYFNGICNIFFKLPEIISKKFNNYSDCFCLLDCIIDLAGNNIIYRNSFDDEYYINPIPYTKNQIEVANFPEFFNNIMDQYSGKNDETKDTILYSLCTALTNRPMKYLVILFNIFGNNGKSTLFGILKKLIPNIKNIDSSAIMKTADKSRQRFALGGIDGANLAYIDESCEDDEISVSITKRITGIENIQKENKGQDIENINQTWILFLITNKKPKFFPSDDIPFKSRLITIEIKAVYYGNNEIYQNYIDDEVNSENLHKEIDKLDLEEKILNEGAGIIKLLSQYYIKLKNEHNFKIPESMECKQNKKSYLAENNTIETFFNDCFEKDNNGFISNEKLAEIYKDYFAGFLNRTFKTNFIKKYKLNQGSKIMPFIYENNQVTKYKTYRGIFGIKEKNALNSKDQENLKYDD